LPRHQWCSQLGKDADYFVYPGNWTEIYETKKDVLDQIKAVQNKQVFDTSGKGSTSWYEQRFAEYEVVALDFCDMVGTASNSGTGEAHKRQWIRNVFTEPIGSLPECMVPDDIDKPYLAEGAACMSLNTSAMDDTVGGPQKPSDYEDTSAVDDTEGGSQKPDDAAENTEGGVEKPTEGAKDNTQGTVSGGTTITFATALTAGFANAILALAL
jgi:hypothetical protein